MYLSKHLGNLRALALLVLRPLQGVLVRLSLKHVLQLSGRLFGSSRESPHDIQARDGKAILGTLLKISAVGVVEVEQSESDREVKRRPRRVQQTACDC